MVWFNHYHLLESIGGYQVNQEKGRREPIRFAPMVEDKELEHNPIAQRRGTKSAFSYMHIEADGRIYLFES